MPHLCLYHFETTKRSLPACQCNAKPPLLQNKLANYILTSKYLGNKEFQLNNNLVEGF